uniref:Ubiquitin-like protease family profile domain-containing protein n=1 Tax=viral metagenome TaxID=1070528 RepID=A0A6C0BCR3_9ZZZZ
MNNINRVNKLVEKKGSSICVNPENNFCIKDKYAKSLIKAFGLPPNAVNNIDELMKRVGCDSPSCLITKPNSSNVSRLLRVSIKPEGDIEGNTWVNSSQIVRVLNSWKIYINPKINNFYPMGFATIDFMSCPNSFNNRVKNLSLNFLIQNKKRTAAVIINTDNCSGRGEHWFPLFIDLRDKVISLEYYNSVKKKMPKQICDYFDDLKNNYIKSGETRDVQIYSMLPDEHQNKNSECGIYSLFYIYSRLEGISGQEIVSYSLPDDHVHKLRKVMFYKG